MRSFLATRPKWSSPVLGVPFALAWVRLSPECRRTSATIKMDIGDSALTTRRLVPLSRHRRGLGSFHPRSRSLHERIGVTPSLLLWTLVQPFPEDNKFLVETLRDPDEIVDITSDSMNDILASGSPTLGSLNIA